MILGLSPFHRRKHRRKNRRNTEGLRYLLGIKTQIKCSREVFLKHFRAPCHVEDFEVPSPTLFLTPSVSPGMDSALKRVFLSETLFGWPQKVYREPFLTKNTLAAVFANCGLNFMTRSETTFFRNRGV